MACGRTTIYFFQLACNSFIKFTFHVKQLVFKQVHNKRLMLCILSSVLHYNCLHSFNLAVYWKPASLPMLHFLRRGSEAVSAKRTAYVSNWITAPPTSVKLKLLGHSMMSSSLSVWSLDFSWRAVGIFLELLLPASRRFRTTNLVSSLVRSAVPNLNLKIRISQSTLTAWDSHFVSARSRVCICVVNILYLLKYYY